MIAFAQKGASAFWAFHDSLFQNQDDLSLVTIERIAKDTDRDFFLSAEEAKEYGLVDEILKKPPGTDEDQNKEES